MQPLDLSSYRHYFPSLKQVIYFDNPGGTQLPLQVIDGMVAYFREANANTMGAFATSRRTDEMIAHARSAMADFLHAASPGEIVFGPNMTTLTFSFSRAIGKTLQVGDEIVVTVLDHDANVAPWLALQEERGVVIRTVDVHPENVTLDMEDMRNKINTRTKVVAVGYASNAAGTINDVATIIRWAHEVGALAWIDAVQFAKDVEQFKLFFLEDALAPEDIEWFERIRDEQGKATTARPITGTINKDVPPTDVSLPIQYLVSLNHQLGRPLQGGQ